MRELDELDSPATFSQPVLENARLGPPEGWHSFALPRSMQGLKASRAILLGGAFQVQTEGRRDGFGVPLSRREVPLELLNSRRRERRCQFIADGVPIQVCGLLKCRTTGHGWN